MPSRQLVRLVFGRLALFWGLFLVYGTTIPFDLARNPQAVAAKWQAALQHLGSRPSISDAVSNVLVFVPWGALLTGWALSARWPAPLALIAAGASGFCLSVVVEGLQLLSSTRVSDANDVIADTFGAVGGSLVALLLAPLPWEPLLVWLRRLVRRDPRTALAGLLAVSVLVVGLEPYDFTIDVGNVKDAVKQARLIPFGVPLRAPPLPSRPWKWASEGLAWTLAGGILARALQERGRAGPRAVLQATALGAFLSFTLECSQLFVRSRGFDMTSTLMAALGSAAGAAWVLLGPARGPRALARAGLICWGLALAFDRFTPGDFSLGAVSRVGPWSLVPFLPYFVNTDVNAVGDLLSEVSGFVPIGALLALSRPQVSRWQAGLLGFAAGASLEVGQAFLPTRTADITDACSAGIGAVLGVAGHRWALSVLPAADEEAAEDANLPALGERP